MQRGPVGDLLQQQIARERELEEGIRRALEEAIELAIERWRDGYGRSYLRGQIDRLFEERMPAETPPTPGYRKKVIDGRMRRQVFERDAYRCVVCGSWEDLTVDHVVPEVRGGSHQLYNLQTLCRSCNSRKGTR